MKKSEFIAARRRHWEDGRSGASLEQRLLWDVDAAEHAGVVWDPEEEPLPERVQLTPAGNYLEYQDADGSWKLLAEVHCSARAAATARELVRRHDAWKEIRRLVRTWTHCRTRDELLAILDGKEGE